MKKLLMLLMVLCMMAPIGVHAQEPSPELAQNGTRIAFLPIVTSFVPQKSSMIWYGGRKIDYRKALRKHPKDRLTTPQSIVDKLRDRLRIKKRLYVPGKGEHVRLRCIYYGGFDYAYSKWVTVR